MRRNASSMSLGRPRERQPHERSAAHSVEVDARRDRNAGVVQQLRAERQRVRGEVRDVGVDVERAVGGRQAVDADRAQPVEQQLAVGRVVMQERVRLGDRFRCERRDGGHLRQRRRADGEVSGQAVHRPLQLLRHQQPAQPPPGHREVLRKAVDHHGISRCLPRAAGRGCALVHQAVVDLVADQPDPGLGAPRRDRGQFVGRNHRPGRVGRARHDHALHRRVQVGEHLRGRLEPGVRSAGHLDDLTAQRRQDVAVARDSRGWRWPPGRRRRSTQGTPAGIHRSSRW